jgi:hypothetical protein
VEKRAQAHHRVQKHAGMTAKQSTSDSSWCSLSSRLVKVRSKKQRIVPQRRLRHPQIEPRTHVLERDKETALSSFLLVSKNARWCELYSRRARSVSTEASARTSNCLSGSGIANTGGLVRASLMAANAAISGPFGGQVL